MGLSAQRIDDMEQLTESDEAEKYCLKNGFVWIVLRRQEKPDGGPADWHIQGVGTDEQSAINLCADESYFIGPLPIDVVMPHELINWTGAYYPLRVKNEADSKAESNKQKNNGKSTKRKKG